MLTDVNVRKERQHFKLFLHNIMWRKHHQHLTHVTFAKAKAESLFCAYVDNRVANIYDSEQNMVAVPNRNVSCLSRIVTDLTAEGRIRLHAIPCKIWGKQSDNNAGSPPVYIIP